jgi:hypothetical protein
VFIKNIGECSIESPHKPANTEDCAKIGLSHNPLESDIGYMQSDADSFEASFFSLIILGFVHLFILFVSITFPLHIGGYYGNGDIVLTGMSMGWGLLGLLTVGAARRDTESARLGTLLLGIMYLTIAGFFLSSIYFP